ncbi:NAD(P)/FAD-dependent oxidoreductase [Thalassospira sp.]|uniref:flavin-containing monooxygenase n=1 Tax=Thalassospira sp. TaxID=1912094 RepID=UPI0032EFF882
MKSAMQDDVLIIGAGLSGLACAKALAKRGISARIFESNQRVAEPWRARHPALRLNIHRHFAKLPDLNPPKSDGVFLRRDTVVRYLEDYAASIDVPIEYGTSVTAIKRNPNGWQVQCAEKTYIAKNVVVATGRDRVPFIPQWPGMESFEGELIHACDLGDVARFDGMRVLVVGAGNSGADVLNHLARHNPADVLVSVRHGPAILPARVFGFPLHRLARLFAMLPAALLDPAFRLTQRLFLGNLDALGLPSHPDGGGTRLIKDGVAFAIDDGFVAALKSGWFKAIPNVRSFWEGRAFLENGQYIRPDVMIVATGYRTGLSRILAHLGCVTPDGQPHYPSGEADLHNPGLWFTGFRPIFTGYFDAAAKTGESIARSIHQELFRRCQNAKLSPDDMPAKGMDKAAE